MALGISIAFIVIGALIVFYYFVFKRDPAVQTPQGKNIVSPTSGKVIAIISSNNLESIEIKKGMMGKIKTIASEVAKEYTIVSIMMTPLDVHFQYAPISGTIISTKHISGTFVNAVSTQSLDILENENNEILIKGSNYKIKVIQIAGFLARRINCYVSKNQKVDKGEKIGFIDLGSQVSLILPSSIKITVKKGQKVIGGQTIIANEKNQ
ncbi:MAG: phosphatidylserine decarboxylase [Candidatus Woesearchaeota archaeon]|jgi:phosphatidylserine decarboxylase|nr:phosphatidylserine decarboxylase [Candidatus Woesearchaeota archaeon]MDP7458192.1 phosphatidylserine decarboxylase [Candidatus Woesearchaeota archaeon]